MKNILIINIFGIGDVLFTTPLITNIKRAYPDAVIGYVCNRRTVEVLETNPFVDKVFIYERDEFHAVYRQSKRSFFKKLIGFLKEIKAEHYDIVIDASMNSFTGFFAFLAGIKQRIGFNYKNRGRFLTTKIPLKGYDDKPVVEYCLDLLRVLDIAIVDNTLKFYLDRQDTDWAEDFLARNGLSKTNRLIGVVPGGGASWGKDVFYRHWPVERYAKLVDKMIENLNATIILMGSEQEQDLCQQVTDLMHHKVYSACGQTTLSQFAALTKRYDVNVLNDGGPLRMAVAVGARTVSLFGPVDERVYGPYPMDQHKVVTKQLACRPCYRRFRRAACEHISCLDIAVEDVFKAVWAVLQSNELTA